MRTLLIPRPGSPALLPLLDQPIDQPIDQLSRSSVELAPGAIRGAPELSLRSPSAVTAEGLDSRAYRALAHRSQTSHVDDLEGRLRGGGTRTAQEAGLPAGRLAEAFRIVATG